MFKWFLYKGLWRTFKPQALSHNLLEDCQGYLRNVIHLLLPGIEYLPDSLSYVLTSPRHQIFVRLCLTPYGTRPPVYLYPV
jgi:hypothetical protein